MSCRTPLEGQAIHLRKQLREDVGKRPAVDRCSHVLPARQHGVAS